VPTPKAVAVTLQPAPTLPAPSRVAPESSKPEPRSVAAVPTPRIASPQPTPAPSPTPAPPPPAPATGELKLVVIPWAQVSVDGQPVGTSPLKPLRLPVGVHNVVLTNPGFQPLQKKVTVEPGKTTTLEVDLTFEGFPK
jgi:serine/threonine-protein kinase